MVLKYAILYFSSTFYLLSDCILYTNITIRHQTENNMHLRFFSNNLKSNTSSWFLTVLSDVLFWNILISILNHLKSFPN